MGCHFTEAHMAEITPFMPGNYNSNLQLRISRILKPFAHPLLNYLYTIQAVYVQSRRIFVRNHTLRLHSTGKTWKPTVWQRCREHGGCVLCACVWVELQIKTQNCHNSYTGNANKPTSGWTFSFFCLFWLGFPRLDMLNAILVGPLCVAYRKSFGGK